MEKVEYPLKFPSELGEVGVITLMYFARFVKKELFLI